MGQKVHPIGARVGVTRGWDSRWCADKQNFGTYLVQDYNIRRYILKTLKLASVPRVEIERDQDEVQVTVHTARPGIVIGRRGQEIDRLRDTLEGMVGRQVAVRIEEIGKPEIDAQLVAMSIAEQLEKRASYRRAIKRAVEAAVQNGALGIKVEVGGRLGGSEIARRDKVTVGNMPLQKLRANIDYGLAEAGTTAGRIGVKVWIYKGDTGEKETSDGPHA